MKVLFIGDVVGNPGRKILRKILRQVKDEHEIGICLANAENAAGGSGITNSVSSELYSLGIDALTLGNHTWSKKEIISFIDSDTRIIRPANFPSETPGKGSTIIDTGFFKLGLINVQGRTFMDPSNCPFRAVDREIEYLNTFTDSIGVDIHAEATSEKIALSWYLDGRVSFIAGTHTHVQTNDERILPNGTGYITDVGMTGPYDGVLGVDKQIVLKRFLTGIPERFTLAKGSVIFNAVVFEIDDKSFKTISISKINRVFNDLGFN